VGNNRFDQSLRMWENKIGVMLSDQFVSDCLIPSGAQEKIKSQGFHVRELEMTDFHKGFLRVLAMLTSVGSLTYGQFIGKALF